MNRRGFLKTFLAAAGGVALAPIIPPPVEAVVEAAAAPHIRSIYPMLKSPVPDLHAGPLTVEMFERARANILRRSAI